MIKATRTMPLTLVVTGVSGIVLVALIMGSIALQRSYAAVTDYATAMNDQARISDYMAVDMRRALDVQVNGSTLTCTVPNYYKTDGSPNPPTITQVTGWPYKKHHHHKHKNIIIDEVLSYDPASTQT